MARLQILELPEGAEDARAPFVLVVDQCTPQRVALGIGQAPVDYWQSLADRIGARGVVVTPETVEIPANEVPIGPDGYPVRLRVEADLTAFRQQVATAASLQGHIFDDGDKFPRAVRCVRCGLAKTEWVLQGTSCPGTTDAGVA